jgi:hypothetical protein
MHIFIKQLRFFGLLLLSFLLALSYQNCSTKNIEFGKITTLSVSGKPDFKVDYSGQLAVGEEGQFIASSESHNLEKVVWTFSDGEEMEGLNGVRAFQHAGLHTFSVKAQFAGSDDWITKNNFELTVNDNDGCIDFDNLQILSKDVNFATTVEPTWYVDTPISMGLNIGNCPTVDNLRYRWEITTADNDVVTIETSNEIRDFSFENRGRYKIVAIVNNIITGQSGTTTEYINIANNIHCKPKEGIGADRDLENLPPNIMVKFSSFFPTCLGYSGNITWHVKGVEVSKEASFQYVFDQIEENIEIRADVEKTKGGISQFYLYANVRLQTGSDFRICENRCAGYGEVDSNSTSSVGSVEEELVCIDHNDQPVDAVFCSGIIPGGYECPDVCTNYPYSAIE